MHKEQKISKNLKAKFKAIWFIIHALKIDKFSVKSNISNKQSDYLLNVTDEVTKPSKFQIDCIKRKYSKNYL